MKVVYQVVSPPPPEINYITQDELKNKQKLTGKNNKGISNNAKSSNFIVTYYKRIIL